MVGTLYATQTPSWQAPDEPAHYNYIAHIARGDGLPVLAMGDFDLAYNGELISKKFPPDMSVEPMRYESYQPPLYYLIAAPIYGLVAGFGEKSGEPYGTALIALRLFGVLLAAISLILLYACAATIFPARPMLSIGATAFAAALPMHAAMTAAVNNDTLAELLILASVLILLRWMRQRMGNDSASGQTMVLPHPNLPHGEGTVTGWTAFRVMRVAGLIRDSFLPTGGVRWGKTTASQTTRPQPANGLGGVSSKFTLTTFQPNPLLNATQGEGIVMGRSAWLRSDQIGRPKAVPPPNEGRLGGSGIKLAASSSTRSAWEPIFGALRPVRRGASGSASHAGAWNEMLNLTPLRLGGGGNSANQTRTADNTPYLLPFLGLLLGLGLLTKIYAYALLPICLLMVLLVTWRTSTVNRVTHAISNIGWVLAPALLLGLPIWIRNMRLYGLFDPLGLTWHDLVVAGQPTLNDWIAQHGWPAYWARALSFTFRSFWGVFGWLGIFLDERIYTLLTLFSAVVAFGLLWTLCRVSWRWRQQRATSASAISTFSEFQHCSLLFLSLMLLMVLACYVLYNTKFVQHQGRYLFWGLLPIGLLVAVGWRTVQQGAAGISASIFAGALSLWLATEQLTQMNLANVNKWTLLSGALIASILMLNSLLYTQTNNAKMNSGIAANSIVTQKRAVPHLKEVRRSSLLCSIYQFNFILPFMLLFGVSIMALRLLV